jgi:hypothetical protein
MSGSVPEEWKAKIAEWATKQGLSFVFLVAIVYGVWKGGNFLVETAIPKHVEQIKTWIKETDEAHREREKEKETAYEKRETLLMERFKDNSDAVRGMAESIDRLADRMANQKDFKDGPRPN